MSDLYPKLILEGRRDRRSRENDVRPGGIRQHLDRCDPRQAVEHTPGDHLSVDSVDGDIRDEALHHDSVRDMRRILIPTGSDDG